MVNKYAYCSQWTALLFYTHANRGQGMSNLMTGNAMCACVC